MWCVPEVTDTLKSQELRWNHNVSQNSIAGIKRVSKTKHHTFGLCWKLPVHNLKHHSHQWTKNVLTCNSRDAMTNHVWLVYGQSCQNYPNITYHILYILLHTHLRYIWLILIWLIWLRKNVESRDWQFRTPRLPAVQFQQVTEPWLIRVPVNHAGSMLASLYREVFFMLRFRPTFVRRFTPKR